MEIVTRKARKTHRCSLCGCDIRIYSKYRGGTVCPWDHIDNDGFYEYKAHIICDEHWNDYGEYCDWYFPTPRGETWDFIESLCGWLRRNGNETPDYISPRKFM